jgi:hypothetical protein
MLLTSADYSISIPPIGNKPIDNPSEGVLPANISTWENRRLPSNTKKLMYSNLE